MKDTPPDVEARYTAILMALDGGRRVAMASEMFDQARRIVIDSIRARHPGIQEPELRQQLFLRFYGHEFEPPERERILEYLARAWREGQGRDAGRSDRDAPSRECEVHDAPLPD